MPCNFLLNVLNRLSHHVSDALTSRTPEELLFEGTVMVVGVGGVGSWAAIAAAMVMYDGKIILVDNDQLEMSNVNRLPVPAIYAYRSVLKAYAVGDVLRMLRPNIEVVEEVTMIGRGGILENLLDKYSPDVVIDAVDNEYASAALRAACRRRGIVMIRAKYDGFHYTFEYIADWGAYGEGWGDAEAGGYTTVPSTPVVPLYLASLTALFLSARPATNYYEYGDLSEKLPPDKAREVAEAMEMKRRELNDQ